MNRLLLELQRLYLPRADPPPSTLTDPTGRVRAMAIELTQPPRWELLSRVWHGLQAELELPAPAIAVSGTDGLQLWFSLAEPVAVADAQAFLDGLRRRFLADIAPARIRLVPAPGASALPPARQDPSGNWSAFVAPDLAPIFDDTPWLDIPPNEEGQAALLRGLITMKPAVFDAAMATLRPTPGLVIEQVGTGESNSVGDPKQFLLRVMDDDTVAMALRIEAAKALLLHADQPANHPAHATAGAPRHPMPPATGSSPGGSGG